MCSLRHPSQYDVTITSVVMKFSCHVNTVWNQNVIPVSNSQQFEFSHVNTPSVKEGAFSSPEFQRDQKIVGSGNEDEEGASSCYCAYLLRSSGRSREIRFRTAKPAKPKRFLRGL